MLVLVTGGTGFVGAHTVNALLGAGHEVKLLVRSADRIAPALEPLGVTVPVEHVLGDVTDPASVSTALEGCEAVVHCASVYSNDPRRANDVTATNLASAKTVLGQAVERGLDPVVHVSSIVALMPVTRDVLSETSEPGRGGPPYPASKQAQERYARELQEQGAPVVITYPGSVWGPFDPYDGESTKLARNFKRGLVPFRPMGGIAVVDVRDVAAAHAAMVERGTGPRRYMLGGHYTKVTELVRLTCLAAGVKRPGVPIPSLMAYMSGRATAPLQRIVPFRLPIDPGGTWAVRWDARVDNGKAERELGASFRPTAETLADQVAWQKAVGRL